uniref:Uncharacterized protein n=1 Tax=Megaviridae environmental sample TaxID=1737588 RepID=A0A5J6VLL2_9VIRU|nr:MAG: hypothetical protein [Megaviridae environmental sample]
MNSVINPFNITESITKYDNELETDITITKNNLNKYFKHIYILCIKKNKKINKEIYKKMISEELLIDLSKELMAYKVNTTLIKNFTHFNRLIKLEKNILELYNMFGYELEEYNLCLPVFNVAFLNVQKYFDTISNNNNLDQLYNLLVLNRFFCEKSNETTKSIISSTISNLDESKYWTFKFNCMYNFSELFFKRTFNFSCKSKLTNKSVKALIHNLDNDQQSSDDDDYLIEIYKKLKYVDPSTCIKFGNYKLFSMVKNCNYSLDDINNIYKELDYDQKFLFVCYMLASKEYSHLILNNQAILEDNIINDINVYNETFKVNLFEYLLSYAWIRFYMEECIRKTKMSSSDNFVFSINTASKLPVFDYDYLNPYTNPYMTILVKEKFLAPRINVHGVEYKRGRKICTYNEFLDRFNIFTTNMSNCNLFANIDFKKLKMAISGSCMTACLQVSHPLMELFDGSDFPTKFSRFCNEYYAKSDIDIMIKTQDMFEFIRNCREIHETVTTNVLCYYHPYAQESHVKLIFKKKLYIRVNKQYILNNILNEDISYGWFIQNINSTEVKTLFSSYLDKFLSEEEKKYPEYIHEYPEYFGMIDYDDINIYVFDENKSAVIIDTKGISENVDIESDIDTDIDEVIVSCINFKAHISAPQLNHDLEIFPIKSEDFGIVSQFHMPCVRAYYDGSDVFILPSCITAHMTYCNMDYKYVSGQKDPVDIINKYRMRGFGTWLNQNEIKTYLKYIEKIPFWKNLYNYSSGHNPTKVLSPLKIDSKIFKPRLWNSEFYQECVPIPFDQPYKNATSKSQSFISNSKYFAINKETGYVNPIKLELINCIKHLTSEYKNNVDNTSNPESTTENNGPTEDWGDSWGPGPSWDNTN